MSMLCYIAINKVFPVPLVPEEHAGAPEAKGWLGMSPIHGKPRFLSIHAAVD